MALVTTRVMQDLENWCFANGLPVAALMEKAALQLVSRLEDEFPAERFGRVAVLVGPGHNGGDALVMARELHLRGRQVRVWFPWESAKELTLAHVQYMRARGVPIFSDLHELEGCDLLIDGLFGFGLNRTLEGVALDAVCWANMQEVPLVALDIPSGLHSDTGLVMGAAVRASRTWCLGHWKRGLLENRAAPYTGVLHLVDIGLPEPAEACDRVIDSVPLREYMPPRRSRDAHKYTAGRALLVAGSAQYPGAALLALNGCRAAGAGYVGLATHASLRSLVVAEAPDTIVLPSDEIGVEQTEAWDAILCGPGLGARGSCVEPLLRGAVSLVLDADALNALAANPSWLGRVSAPVIMTPHYGEFAHLFPDLAGHPSQIEAARQASQRTGFVVVLKGPHTIVAEPGGLCHVNLRSTPALARAGTGDVLAGLITGLLAQRLPPVLAAIVGVCWHSEAARILEARDTASGVNAASLSHFLPTAAAALRECDSRRSTVNSAGKIW